MNWRADEGVVIFNWFPICFYNYVSKVSTNYRSINMAIIKVSDMDWKEKQYAAHHRLSKKMGWDFSDNNPYFERFYIVLPNPRIKTKAQMKEELKKHGYK
jgi:hypothetical protein